MSSLVVPDPRLDRLHRLKLIESKAWRMYLRGCSMGLPHARTMRLLEIWRRRIGAVQVLLDELAADTRRLEAYARALERAA